MPCDASVSVVGGACEEVDWHTKVDRPRCRGSVMVYAIQGQDGCEDTSPMASPLWDTTSLEMAKAKIAAYAKGNPERAWIIGTGWNQEKWGLGRFPTAADLDAGMILQVGRRVGVVGRQRFRLAERLMVLREMASTDDTPKASKTAAAAAAPSHGAAAG